MARGRLQYAFLAGLRPLDTAATDSAGQYDSELRETKRVDDGTWNGSSGRVETEEIRVKCQIEEAEFERLDPLLAGFEHQHKLSIVCHFRDLQHAGLVDAPTGQAGLRVTCRLVAIYDLAGNVQQVMPGDGVYCIEARPVGYGCGRRLNLLVLTFECREKSPRS